MTPANDNHTPYWPRGLSRLRAAQYVGIKPSDFDKLVDEAKMPKAKRFCGRNIWDRVELDRAFDLLDGGQPKDTAGDEIFEFAA